MEAYFNDLSRKVFAALDGGEVLLLNLEGETTDFVRLNKSKIRQAGNVRQYSLQLDLVVGHKHITATIPLSGDQASDCAHAINWLRALRVRSEHVPDNPYLNYSLQPKYSREERLSQLPQPNEAVDCVLTQAQGLDLVGIWASGEQVRGFASSLGQFNWHAQSSFNFDWSVYHSGDKAVKENYAGAAWDRAVLEEKIRRCRSTLGMLGRQPKSLKPGRYRVYLTPSALNEIMNLLHWGGFGLKSHRTLQTPLIKMVKEGKRLDPQVTLVEDHRSGLAPTFTRQGFLKPERVNLIESGEYRDCLVNASDGKEYGMEVNCSIEHPQSLVMQGGVLAEDEVLKELGTGVYVSNLWYCNYSDRNACRITGMTRFASLWVENGTPVAPIEVMRFDESLYSMLGDNLIALTRERQHLLDTSTYEKRSESSALLPGALVDNFAFTL